MTSRASLPLFERLLPFQHGIGNDAARGGYHFRVLRQSGLSLVEASPNGRWG